jgi:hypothetical protein
MQTALTPASHDHLGIISNVLPSNEQPLGYLWLDDRDPKISELLQSAA